MGADARNKKILAGVAVTTVVLAIVGYVGFGSDEQAQAPQTTVQESPRLASDTPLEEDASPARRDTSQTIPRSSRGRLEADKRAAIDDEQEEEQAPSAKKKDKRKKKGSRRRSRSSEAEDEDEAKKRAPKEVPPERPF
ncbi:MAG: hypothetical protein O7D91_00485 [Planctomycetota bacterium]|nr:hypothetical protein [Planctomycetota bacterium]